MMTGVVSAEQAVLEANQRFYQALSELDTEAMEQIWLHEPWVRCIHPGWQVLSGWDDVWQSWRQIFSNTLSHQVEASDITVRLFGELAWVLCLERIIGRPESGNLVSFAQGTNLICVYICRVADGAPPCVDGAGWNAARDEHHGPLILILDARMPWLNTTS